jgi:xylitol oxidase
MTRPLTNWAGNIRYQARRVHLPSSVAQVQDLVADADRIRAVGSGHSFNGIADSAGDQVSLAGLPPVIDIDRTRATVKVAAGVRYGELSRALHAGGFALPSLGSLPHITVAGSCATGTHGSGIGNQGLAASVSALDLVTADGTMITLSRAEERDDFLGAVVGLGALGIVTAMTLDIVPTFEVRQLVYEGLSRDAFQAYLPDILAAAYSVSVFTDWRSDTGRVWTKQRMLEGPTPLPTVWPEAREAERPHHPLDGMPVERSTEQLGVPGPWHERLPHFRLEFTPSSGEELQSEYLLPREHAVDASAQLWAIGGLIAPVLQVSEIRTVAADDLWLSPSHQTDSVAFHFTWIKDMAAVAPVITAIEDRLSSFGARPHWGKLFSTDPAQLRGRYPRHHDFVELLARYDPRGVFRNDFLDRYFPRGSQ